MGPRTYEAIGREEAAGDGEPVDYDKSGSTGHQGAPEQYARTCGLIRQSGSQHDRIGGIELGSRAAIDDLTLEDISNLEPSM